MHKHGHSEACCTVPAAQHEYSEKGSYENLAGMKTYKTGPASATTAILVIYDVFGFSNQLLQGADIMAHADDAHHQYQVYVPDLLHGEYAEHSWIPPDTEEKQKKLGAFFGGPAAPAKAVETVPKFLEAVKQTEAGKNITTWGIMGFCWGGKIVSLTCGEGTKFSAAAELHPAMVDPTDAEKIKIPLIMLASQGEDADDVGKFEKNLTGKKHVEIFKDQVHGWMTARGDLKDSRVKEEYERGYSTVLTFFHEHM